MKGKNNQFTTCLVQFQFKDICKPQNSFLQNLFHMCKPSQLRTDQGEDLYYMFNHSAWLQEDGKVDAIQEKLQKLTGTLSRHHRLWIGLLFIS